MWKNLSHPGIRNGRVVLYAECSLRVVAAAEERGLGHWETGTLMLISPRESVPGGSCPRGWRSEELSALTPLSSLVDSLSFVQ